MFGAVTIKQPFNQTSQLAAGKIDLFFASYNEFENVLSYPIDFILFKWYTYVQNIIIVKGLVIMMFQY